MASDELNGPIVNFLKDLTNELTDAFYGLKKMIWFSLVFVEVANATLGTLRVRLAKELGLMMSRI